MLIYIDNESYEYIENTGKFYHNDKELHFSFYAGKIDTDIKDQETVTKLIDKELKTKGNQSRGGGGRK